VSEPRGPAPGEWRRTSPLSFVVGAILSLRSAVLPTLAALIGTGLIRQGWIVIVPALAAMGLFAALFSFLAWRKFRYRLGETDIRVERGLFSRTARSVPYERIQDVSLEQRLVPRLFGMVEVKFETGAGGKDEVRVRYVSSEEAVALRETVRVRMGDAATISGATGVTEDASPILFAMDHKRLATFGLFEFSLVVFVVLAGAAQQFDFLLPIDIWNTKGWATLLGDPGYALEGASVASQVIAAMLAVALLSLVGLATGIIRTVLRDYGFRLEDTPKGLRRRRGLLTRSDVIMPAHRVQALVLRTGIIRRLFGWHGLSVVSLAQDAKAGNHVIVPFAKMAEIAPVVAAIGLALPSGQTDWHRPSRRQIVDSALLSLIPPSLAVLATGIGGRCLEQASQALLPVLVAFVTFVGLLAARAHFRWNHDRHAIDDQYLYVRQGWFAPRLDLALLVKLQSVEIVQGPIAQRRGYAGVQFGLAGGTLMISGISLERARAIRAAVLRNIGLVHATIPAPADQSGVECWSNWSGSESSRPRAVLRPRDEHELGKAIKEARSVRATGAGHSFMPLCQSDDLIVSLEDMAGTLSVAPDRESVRAPAGWSLKRLTAALWTEGLALANQGDVNPQSLAGSLATGTHGTGRDHGSLATFARGFRLVMADGEPRWCDAKTDPDLFAAQRLSLGLFGIATEIEIAVVPAFHLIERTHKKSWDEVRETFDQLAQQHRHIEFWFFPHADDVILKTLDLTDPSDPPPPADPADEQAFGRMLEIGRATPDRVPELQRRMMAEPIQGRRWGPAHTIFPSERTLRFEEMEYEMPRAAGLETLDEVVRWIRKGRLPVSFPFEYRVVAPDDIWMSPMNRGPVAAISMHQYAPMPWRELFAEAEAIFRGNGGRPHWAKRHTLSRTDVDALYPMAARFREVRRSADPAGKFLNAHLAELFS